MFYSINGLPVLIVGFAAERGLDSSDVEVNIGTKLKSWND
jgi:hypothetical protein